MNGTVIQSEITLFQVGKQFDALVVDTSAPVFDTFASDTLNVSKSILLNTDYIALGVEI